LQRDPAKKSEEAEQMQIRRRSFSGPHEHMSAVKQAQARNWRQAYVSKQD
jgi:hypothetical protein